MKKLIALAVVIAVLALAGFALAHRGSGSSANTSQTQTQPYDISVASDGQKALELCKQQEFDLILLDLMMPRMDGATFLEHYKKLATGRAKVIIMSNLSSGDELTRALSLGAYRSVIKADVSPRQLIEMVSLELQPA